MPARDDRKRKLDQFRLALHDNVSMPEAARRLDRAEQEARAEAARRTHGEAMRRLYAKGYGRNHKER